MGWFSRRKAAPTEGRAEQRAEVNRVREHLEDFIRTRRGVEAFVEPATTMNPPTVLLIASSGEWTRRRVLNPVVLRELSERLMIPVYDIQQVGYPQRMRDWNERAKRGLPQPVEDTELPPWPQ
ncbi:hypothetical protein [Kineosporia succinea]|uniref:Oxidoreductase n=1 Tax=Kineosporia succinea TaxID=84632 RepID=A0ABT9P692_9ACTN|nr:hypothetical protein [Kineosporia succinea]MDP9828206.1 hypothetical protein [Kineosporia succinea]